VGNVFGECHIPFMLKPYFADFEKKNKYIEAATNDKMLCLYPKVVSPDGPSLHHFNIVFIYKCIVEHVLVPNIAETLLSGRYATIHQLINIKSNK
jgi:hypothetical protein